MRYTDRCPTDSDPSEAPSDDSDNSSAPPRRYRATQKGSRARANKVRTLNRWTTEEHDKLAYLVDKWGSEKNWAKVAEEMPGRTGKQCRERWLNHMKPGIVKGNWSPEEEFLLAQCHALVGSHWSKMTKRLPGRTENSIKNFWNATLRSKAPNKKRGMLWTYMQLHDAKSDDNTLALVTAVSRLHETRELPPHLLAQMDEGLLDSRTWKAIHKAEKEFLEAVGGELHYLSLPHPSHGLGMGLLQGYCGAAGAVAAAAGASPAASPVASSSQVPEYSYSQGNHQYVYSTSYVGHKVGSMTSHSYLQPSGAASHYSSAADTHYHTMQGGLSSEALGGLLSSAVPGAVGGGNGSSAAAAAAAGSGGGYGLPSLLTAQDPLLSGSCLQDSMDTELIKMFEAAPNSGSAGASTLGSCATLAANNSAVFAAAADSAAAAAAGVLPPPKELAPIITTAVKAEATSDGSASTYASQSQMGPGSAAATDGKAAAALQLAAGQLVAMALTAAAGPAPTPASYTAYTAPAPAAMHATTPPAMQPASATAA
ncbi:hypothetical protein OEZ86_014402 [Tetradesmus obliquus]|nr:hypothetical protein OEZ86_014402 [Tetradesmus obliquus]